MVAFHVETCAPSRPRRDVLDLSHPLPPAAHPVEETKLTTAQLVLMAARIGLTKQVGVNLIDTVYLSITVPRRRGYKLQVKQLCNRQCLARAKKLAEQYKFSWADRYADEQRLREAVLRHYGLIHTPDNESPD